MIDDRRTGELSRVAFFAVMIGAPAALLGAAIALNVFIESSKERESHFGACVQRGLAFYRSIAAYPESPDAGEVVAVRCSWSNDAF